MAPGQLSVEKIYPKDSLPQQTEPNKNNNKNNNNNTFNNKISKIFRILT